jgi:hypothetical protein
LSAAARLVASLALCATALAACGGGGASASGVRLVSTSPRGEVSVKSDSPRLVAASKELTALLGHEVTFDLDAALLPDHAPHLETAFADAVETAAHALSVIKRDDPRAFAYAAPLVKALVVRYDATLREPRGELDETRRELRIRVPRASFTLVTDGAIHAAVDEAHHAYIAKRYSRADPRGLSQDELEEMWETILHHWRYEKKEDPPPQPPAWDPGRKIVSDDARGRAVLRALSLFPHAEGELRARLVEWLMHERHYLLLAWEHHADEARRAPPDSVLKHVQKAWVAWFVAELPRLEIKYKVEIARLMFHVRPRDPEFAQEALAGFDAFAFGLEVFDAWVKAGMPTGGEGDNELADTVVCPHHVDADGQMTRNRGCGPGWHRMALAAERRATFAKTLLRAPPAAAASLAAGLKYESEQVVALMRSVESSAPHHTAVLRVLAHDLRFGSREAARVEGFRLYRAGAGRRGGAMYLLMSTDFAHGVDDVLPGLAPPPAATELAAMLDVTPDAMRFAPALWGHVQGGREADAVVAHLDRFIDDGATPVAYRGEPDATVQKLVEAACRGGRPADLASLHAYFARRASTHAGEASRWASVRDQTRPGACLHRASPSADGGGPRSRRR